MSRVKFPADRTVANIDESGRTASIEWDVVSTDRFVVLDIQGGMTSARMPLPPRVARVMAKKLLAAADKVDPPEEREKRLKAASGKARKGGPRYKPGKVAKAKVVKR